MGPDFGREIASALRYMFFVGIVIAGIVGVGIGWLIAHFAS